MPTVRDENVTAFAHCARPRCAGNQQVEVEAIRRETSRTYREMGGDSPGVEASWVTYVWPDESEAPCSSCGKVREISAQPRKDYDNISGEDPLGLLDVQPFNAARQREILASPVVDEERQKFQEQLERLQAQVLELTKDKASV